MKSTVPYIVKYIITGILLTVAYRTLITWGLLDRDFPVVITASIQYGSLMLAACIYWAAKERKLMPLYEVVFRFHLATFAIINGTSEIWFLSGMNAPVESIDGVHTALIALGAVVLIHFIVYLLQHSREIRELHEQNYKILEDVPLI